MQDLQDKLIGFVIPAKDEAPTLRELYSGIANQCEALKVRFEVIFVDDGSTDNTWDVMQSLADEFPHTVRSVKLRNNVGKDRALATGFSYCRSDITFTMDADLQDDPVEIPRFLEKLGQGYDLVSGYKQKRYDPWHKVYPSRIFNKMLSSLSGVHLHDHNCGFKCYKAEVTKSITLYGSMHRMVPVLASMEGFQVGEIVVQHHPRRFGVSKYGARRMLNGFMDMLTVTFLKYFRESTLHVFGRIALLCMFLGASLLSVATALEILSMPQVILSILGANILVVSLPILAIGFVSELIISGKRGNRYDIPLALDTYNIRNPSEIVSTQSTRTLLVSGNSEFSPRGPAKVLLVEDDAISRKMIRLMLKNSDTRLIEAIDGQEGLELLTSEIDIVILDVNMPKMDGIAFLSEMRHRGLRAKVIVQTASSKIDFAIQAMKLGAFDYITKPFTRDQLLSSINKARKVTALADTYDSLTLPKL